MNEMLWAHCCCCDYRVSRSAPGTKSILVCPKCGSTLEIRVDSKTVRVTILKMKEQLRTEQAS